ncbi:MAG TPA: protein translocase subunit SecF [Actinomycetota bacterium]
MRGREAIATFRGHHIPNIDFLGRRKWWFALSGTFIVLSLVGLFARGLNFSIDFKGGALLEFPNRSGATVGDYTRVLNTFGLKEAKVEILTGGQCPQGCVNIRSKSLTQLGLLAPAPTTPSPSAVGSPTPSANPSASASASAAPTPTPTATAAPTPSASASVSASPTPPPVAQATTPEADRLRLALAKEAGVSANDINETDVGPTWGGTISRKAVTALIVFLVLVTAYISLRFEPKMALGALVALGHDMIITAGIYALVGREVTPETVIAILTILGYSLYDTVVIFDKIKENTETVSLVARETYTGVANMSLNQTFMRSVNTSLVVLLPIGALLLFGGQTLKDFAFALFIGVASGTYSSIFVAAPVLSILKEREPRYQQIRSKAQARAARPGLRAVPAERELEPAGVIAPSQGRPGGTQGSSQRPRPAGTATKKKKGKPQGKPKRRRR